MNEKESKDYIQCILRQQILEDRIHLRECRQLVEETKILYQRYLDMYDSWADKIEALQKSLGEEVDIDPSYDPLVRL